MTLETIALISLVLAVLPAGMFLINLFFYRRISKLPPPGQNSPALSVLIPARNEAHNLRATLDSVLANRGIEFEVIVLDDHSTDQTAEIVREFAARDSRVRLELAPGLPPGWCGKPHACQVLAACARNPLLIFMDADVRLAPDALVRMAGFMSQRDVALASGVPRQELGTFSERLLIPLIHFVLLGYLPMLMMRWTRRPGFSAGCGQLFVARADAYRFCGGHAAIRATLHDGVKLPRLFRRAGFRTDLFDATDLAACRMYHTNAETWGGLGKNATEGLGAPETIVPMSFLIFGGQVLPFILLLLAPWLSLAALKLAGCAAVLAWLPRLIAAWRFRQPFGSALLQPVGIVALLFIQWLALVKKILGRPMEWKGREYSHAKLATKPQSVAVSLIALSFAIGLALLESSATAGPTNNVCPPFELRDQFDQLHQVTFPRTNLIVLTVADKEGNAEVDGWVMPVNEHYGRRIQILGVADVRGVPGFWRPTVRKRFVEARKHPVMLDWDGGVPGKLKSTKGHANIYLLDRQGCVKARFTGGADAHGLKQLFAALDREAAVSVSR